MTPNKVDWYCQHSTNLAIYIFDMFVILICFIVEDVPRKYQILKNQQFWSCVRNTRSQLNSVLHESRTRSWHKIECISFGSSTFCAELDSNVLYSPNITFVAKWGQPKKVELSSTQILRRVEHVEILPENSAQKKNHYVVFTLSRSAKLRFWQKSKNSGRLIYCPLFSVKYWSSFYFSFAPKKFAFSHEWKF